MPASWSRASFGLKVGSAFSERDLRARLEALGYDLGDEPDYPGGVLFHGNTFEIFPAGALGPFRIEHSGQVIRRIAAFDPIGQEVLSEVKELLIDPMSERLAFGRIRGKRSNLFDYCERSKWIADAGVPAHADSWLSTIEEAAGRTETEREYLGRRDWKRRTKRMKVLSHKAAFRPTPDFSKVASPRKELRAFVDETRGVAGSRLVFVAAQEEDLRAMERLSGVKAERFPDWSGATAERNREASLLVDFDAGFVVPGRKPLVVVTASDVLGSRAHHPQPMARAWNAAFDHTDVPELGSVVVHLQRGLGLLDGLQSVATGDVSSRDMIRLVFAGEDAVLVPPADLALIWPYASELGELTLDKADGSTWWARRTEAEQEIQIAGKQLSKYISQRRRRRAPKLAPPGPVYERFVARFPYFTTVDQAKAVRDVLDDLASGHPMDRVICGDVGFGKTEVALRAAAAVVLSGKQVAIAVPTTVLARQHVATFRKRFAPFNIEVGSLVASRFGRGNKGGEGGAKERKIESRGRNAGSRLQGCEVRRPRFGNHRRGAAFWGGREGEAFRTSEGYPCPLDERHANSSDSRGRSRGLQGFSVIASPPIQRLPVVTKVAPLSDAAIASALLREQRRHGQSFLICPRIQDLAPMLARLQSVAPDLRVVCLHGKLPVDEIDDRMMSFVEGATYVCWRPTSWRVVSISRVQTRSWSVRPKGLALRNSISSEEGSGAVGYVRLRTC